ncbi:MAG: hypothetical protein IPM57_07435 [Oligoflexia bacterium]|nr:hypothetical protein [Oligoflexia bacterium]
MKTILVIIALLGISLTSKAENLSCKEQKAEINKLHVLQLVEEFEKEAQGCEITLAVLKELTKTLKKDPNSPETETDENKKKEFIQKVLPRTMKALSTSCQSILTSFSNEVKKIDKITNEGKNFENVDITQSLKNITTTLTATAQNLRTSIDEQTKDLQIELHKTNLSEVLTNFAITEEKLAKDLTSQLEAYKIQLDDANQSCKANKEPNK